MNERKKRNDNILIGIIISLVSIDILIYILIHVIGII